VTSPVAVIPARYASTRYPGKPLVPLLGQPMLLWVADVCAEALGAKNVIIATDDSRIRTVASDAGFHVEMTSDRALTGTDRIAEVANRLATDVILNVQGDEPLLDPGDLLRIAQVKAAHPELVVNGYCPLGPDEDPTNTNLPKVVIDRDERLLYMSRCAVPGTKRGEPDPAVTYLKQVCIYGFSPADLRLFKSVPTKGPLEAAEDIEILRFLELGQRVRMVRTSTASLAVDTPDDVAKVEEALLLSGRNAGARQTRRPSHAQRPPPTQ
jgi:3-deoxy-manno-octulosonate cytidylyltransferase (CMP-KDO synthetase)